MVIAGLDPAFHRKRIVGKLMDAGVEPGMTR
jgi:hypothetical protein